jgi:hypothetical protein
MFGVPVTVSTMRVARWRIIAKEFLQKILGACAVSAGQQTDEGERKGSGSISNHKLGHSGQWDNVCPLNGFVARSQVYQ